MIHFDFDQKVISLENDPSVISTRLQLRSRSYESRENDPSVISTRLQLRPRSYESRVTTWLFSRILLFLGRSTWWFWMMKSSELRNGRFEESMILSSLEVSKMPTVWTLQSTHHRLIGDANVLLTLRQRLTAENVKWRDDVEFIGEFRYLSGYWEWSEDILSRCADNLRKAGIYDAVYASLFTYDRNTEIIKAFCEAWCPKTNTLLTSLGEMSISLWDIHVLSGLPMNGELYDEVIPCAKELTGADQDNKLYVPASCKHLFHAYHLLRGQSSSVSIGKWITFWSKNTKRYSKPPLRKEKKIVRPKSTHNPTGEIKVHKTWTAKEKMPFEKLDVKERYVTQTYLAAYLSYWLCSFVLPEDDANLIRPETFKMASMMASGREVALTVPVLASIYRVLNDISSSLELIPVQATFPIHFVYSWLGCYFKTHFSLNKEMHTPRMIHYSGEGGAMYYDHVQARAHFQEWDQMSWDCMMLSEAENIWYVDDGEAPESHQCFFMAIRCNYLTKRLGDHFIIEPYSPHRFSRQFGYYQSLPGVVDQDIREAPLDVGLKYWRICLLSDSTSRVCFPRRPSSVKNILTTAYKNWWDLVHRDISSEKPTTLILPQTDVVECQKLAAKVDSLSEKRKTRLDLGDDSISRNVERHWKRQKRHEKPVEDYAESGHAVVSVVEVAKDCSGATDLENKHDSAMCGQSLQQSGKPTKIRSTPPLGEMSEFNGQALYDTHRRTFLKGFWSDLQSKILRTQAEFISSIKEDVLGGFLSIQCFSSGFDLSYLKNSLDTFFSQAAAYDEARSASFESAESSLQHLKETKQNIREARTKKKGNTSQIKSLKNHLAELDKQRECLSKSLKEHQDSQKAIQLKIKEFEKELAEQKSAFGAEAAEKVANLRSHLESAKEALEDQNLFV
ncbi:hypothetical protein C2S52_000088 [Perilla frutescens var. hirtella]|nr:hypothetical protein C2S52_000088 [Perilla frutescens var. hirtella]